MNKTIIAHTPTEMEEIGIEMAAILTDGMVVSLVGPLGSGKTTLTKGIAKGLLITDVVVSPSYLIARSYEGRLCMHHIDAYRVSTLQELAEVGLDDYLPPETGVSIVEWPDRIEGLVDISTIQVTIELLESEFGEFGELGESGEGRRVSISKR
jgi:tRNA threonylcarbamoyladenosine biosynthesis protein TsaE